MNNNELRTTLGYFKQAMKFFVRFEKEKRPPDAMISFSDGYLVFEAEGEAAVIRAEGEWNGRAWISTLYLAAFYRAPPVEKEVVILYDDGRLRISTLSIKCRWETLSQNFIKRVEQPELIDLVAFDRTMPRAEIYAAGLAGRVLFAQKEKTKLIKRAAKTLEPFGISEGDIAELVDIRVQQHIDQAGEEGQEAPTDKRNIGKP